MLDYAPRLEELLSDPNPFALVTAAHLLTQHTRHDVQARYAAKWRLARLLYERDWDKQRIIDLFAVIDWLLHLPQDLELQLWTSINELERNMNMPYVTSVERIGREEGIQQGIQQGIQKEVDLALRLLVRRCGTLSIAQQEQVRSLPITELENLCEALLDFSGMEDLEVWLRENII